MEYSDLICTRESIRNYDPTRPVPKEILAAENEGVGASRVAAYNPALLKEAINPGKNQLIFGITPVGYPKPGFKKTLIKKRKTLEDIVDYL